MSIDTPALDAAGLRRFVELGPAAVDAVTERFYTEHGASYAQFGPRGRAACREDLAFHLEFLRPVLEFGLIQPMLDYLHWLAQVLASRDVPATHLALSLEWLAEFFASHLDGADAAIVLPALHDIQARFQLPNDGPSALDRLMPEAWPESDLFARALLGGDQRGARALLDQCFDQGHGLVATEMHMIQPALYSVGQQWQNNQVSVAQEHLATAIAQSVMTRGLLKSRLPASNGRTVLLACVEGNNHCVGLQMVADAFQFDGWEVQYLGASVPTAALVKHVGLVKPHLLGLSVSFAQQLRVVKDVMAQLALALGAARPPVIVGGLAINQFSPLANQLGADGWSANAQAAVDHGSRLALPARP